MSPLRWLRRLIAGKELRDVEGRARRYAVACREACRWLSGAEGAEVASWIQCCGEDRPRLGISDFRDQLRNRSGLERRAVGAFLDADAAVARIGESGAACDARAVARAAIACAEMNAAIGALLNTPMPATVPEGCVLVEPEELAHLVVREACETEPADEDDPECIRILRSDLKSAVLVALDEAAPMPEVARG